ncbi:DEAD/DEAH box helicase [Boudabousia liubingyangii]|uniref:DEAD/DEAH box helicase n=1 Tax=Boudabousia liubingyangii TaxID=1921764 RepID=A0A1Q5PMP0_9ACTO|nr:DEAD/DEAH box helicase [Boudabousia liubingyangii]OKL48821.1 DEAD/DEAH box helicase [Boudabousia liubingyangii]
MLYKPHNYQQVAIDFVEQHPVAALLLEMGLGKSSIALTAIWNLMYDRFEVQRVLVVAPLRVARDTWPAEASKWDHLAGLTMAVAVGSEAKRLAALNAGADVTVINRENVTWLIERSGVQWQWDMVVIDELSSFKNHQAKRFRSLLKARPLVRRIVGLTGTPAANGLEDLWAQFRLLDMGERLGRYITHYRREFFDPDKRNGMQVFSYKPKPGAEDEIYKRISDVTISMRTCDHLTLPEVTYNTIEVAMGDKGRRAYERMLGDLVLELEGTEVTAANAAALSGKLTQMASGALYDEDGNWHLIHDAKLDALEDLVEGANGKPVLVAYWFAHDLERITKRFPEARLLKTAADMDAWNNGEIPLALIHPASAGHGLNLQAGGSTLIWFTLTWSLELYQQTNARLHRQGQQEPVVIHHLAAKDSIDQKILSALAVKDTTQAALIDAVKATITMEGVGR